MKFILMYCLLAPNGHGIQECWQVPATTTYSLQQCSTEQEQQEDRYKPYRLVCWRTDDEENQSNDGT